MTLDDIAARLTAEGYTNCHFSGKQIILPGLGEIELAYGEVRIFDAKQPWPGYGDHPLHSGLDALFADIASTWPLAKPEPEPEVEPEIAEVEDDSDESHD